MDAKIRETDYYQFITTGHVGACVALARSQKLMACK
jgi:hypothetical protein